MHPACGQQSPATFSSQALRTEVGFVSFSCLPPESQSPRPTWTCLGPSGAAPGPSSAQQSLGQNTPQLNTLH